ncbi:MAG: anthranilate phosphoribosyltransferase [Mariprofundaceae bacterium]
MSTNIQQAIRSLQAGDLISEPESEKVFSEIMQGAATPAQIGALLMGLTMQGETADIITGAARAMRSAATRIQPLSNGLLDTCGTGGDGAATFNISTAVAIVVASAGQPVAKHGNRAVSSRSGSADVLEALGVNIMLAPDQVAACIDKTGIGFLFAPGHHPAMKYAAGPRRELGIRSIFNLLGPLSNPAEADYQVLGVFSRDKLELMAKALLHLGSMRALLVHGRDGMDEITTSTISDAIWVEKGWPLRQFEIDPKAFGIPYASAKDLSGGSADDNAQIMMEILAGKKGPKRDITLLNAAAALWLTEKVEGIPQGIKLAAACIDSGKARKKLQALIDFSQNCG